ncbi:MAG TPA: glycosyltransferase family 9 protein, partial [Candidatus Rifleibacterium sp.]|nr:glycosyltransferase family 9 protein [Candidatus Rifleibacterium sp.]
HPAGRSVLATWRAGIRRRVGRASNVFQLFLNDRRVQKRSRNEKHEFAYNLDLLNGIVPAIDFLPWSFKLPAQMIADGTAFLARAGMAGCKPVIVHPGHGGSAHNISTAMYAQLVAGLLQNDVPVLVSLGPNEESLRLQFPAPIHGRLAFASDLPDLAALAGVFAGCSAFCGGSTGPLHLAAALQLPCAAFFPPVAAMTPKRWGPVGCASLIIKPEIADCDGRCTSCGSNGCMSRLQIQPAVAWLTGERKK